MSESPIPESKKFQFDVFLKQLRSKKADPILRYIKSFIKNFSSRRWTVDEQIKLIIDFRDFIFVKIEQHEPFSLLNDLENTKIGIEKLIMNKLFNQVYSPQIIDLDDSHKLDLQIDYQLSQIYEQFTHLTAKELDVDETLINNGEELIKAASSELNKINDYKTPRAKSTILLNGCKILFQLIKLSNQNLNADEFLPLLIYTLLKFPIEHLYSNLIFIERFSFIKKSEVDYYLVSFNAALEFIRNLPNRQEGGERSEPSDQYKQEGGERSEPSDHYKQEGSKQEQSKHEQEASQNLVDL